VLKRHGVILESRVQIRLGQVPGISRFGKQAKVGNSQFLNQLILFCQDFVVI
jgi:hypothetical protein